MAATNKCLAQRHKTRTGGNARGLPFTALKLNMNWHNPDLYFFFGLLAGLAALLAIIYECVQRFYGRKPPVVEPGRSNEKAVDPPSPPKSAIAAQKARPLDRLQHDRQGGAADAQSAREFRTVFNMTSQASKEAMIEKWMRRQGCSRSEAMRLAVEEWRRDNR